MSSLQSQSDQKLTTAIPAVDSVRPEEKTITLGVGKFEQLLREIRSRADRSRRANLSAVQQDDFIIAGCDELLRDLTNLT